MNRFEIFQKNYNEAITNINRFLHIPKNQHDYSMVSLVKWMMETDANPYSYLPHNWAGSTNNAEMFSSLLHTIHHALYDDGDITFVTVNGEPRIVFVWKHEENFRNYVLSDTEKDIENRHGEEQYEIAVLDIEPGEFGPLYDRYQKEWLKECFITDAARDIEWAATAYRKYKCWDNDWILEAKELYGENRNTVV